jgi:hypothetical protein
LASFRAAVAAPARSPRSRPAAAPGTRPRPKPAKKAAPRTASKPRVRPGRRTRSHGAIAWIFVGGALLAGVVFVNLAVLQLNLRLDKATQERSQLKAQNASLVAQLSSALASPRIQKLAHQRDGLVQADPSTIGYIDLAAPSTGAKP